MLFAKRADSERVAGDQGRRCKIFKFSNKEFFRRVANGARIIQYKDIWLQTL